VRPAREKQLSCVASCDTVEQAERAQYFEAARSFTYLAKLNASPDKTIKVSSLNYSIIMNFRV
jgi:hypothetical protein